MARRPRPSRAAGVPVRRHPAADLRRRWSTPPRASCFAHRCCRRTGPRCSPSWARPRPTRSHDGSAAVTGGWPTGSPPCSTPPTTSTREAADDSRPATACPECVAAERRRLRLPPGRPCSAASAAGHRARRRAPSPRSTPAVAFAAGPASADTVVVLSLRGGFDGLSAVAPVGDPAYAALRPGIGVPAAAALPLDPMFGLHPALSALKPLYDAGRWRSCTPPGCPRRTARTSTPWRRWSAPPPARRCAPAGWTGCSRSAPRTARSARSRSGRRRCRSRCSARSRRSGWTRSTRSGWTAPTAPRGRAGRRSCPPLARPGRRRQPRAR